MSADPNAMDEESPFRERDAISNIDAEHVLATGTLEVLGQMPWSSNATLLCDVVGADRTVQAVYKPARGERPLWDFPSGLFRREVACYELAKLLGWDLVPPTVLVDGPAGPGSLQHFVPCDFSAHYFTLQDRSELVEAFQQLAAFDVVANSTDRKSGHVLVDGAQHIWAIDNGLSFHEEFKLRTVLWDFAGDQLPQQIIDDLLHFAAAPSAETLETLLAEDEVNAAKRRSFALATSGRFPTDPSGRRWPWPLV